MYLVTLASTKGKLTDGNEVSVYEAALHVEIVAYLTDGAPITVERRRHARRVLDGTGKRGERKSLAARGLDTGGREEVECWKSLWGGLALVLWDDARLKGKMHTLNRPTTVSKKATA